MTDLLDYYFDEAVCTAESIEEMQELINQKLNQQLS
jgi:hypothetical protein